VRGAATTLRHVRLSRTRRIPDCAALRAAPSGLRPVRCIRLRREALLARASARRVLSQL